MKCSNEPLSGNCFESVKVRTKRAKRVRLYKMKIKKKEKIPRRMENSKEGKEKGFATMENFTRNGRKVLRGFQFKIVQKFENSS